jgi:hypothetical protein
MNVNGPLSPPRIVPPPAPRADRPGAPATAPAPASAAKPAAASGLWELLTPEERAYFEEQAALGPLTYRPGRGRPEAPPAPLGRRIDVRG